MKTPTPHEAIEHLAEHYGLTKEQARELVRTPLHPAGLRDEFAIAALAGLMAHNHADMYVHREDMADRSYLLADAMLRRRLR